MKRMTSYRPSTSQLYWIRIQFIRHWTTTKVCPISIFSPPSSTWGYHSNAQLRIFFFWKIKTNNIKLRRSKRKSADKRKIKCQYKFSSYSHAVFTLKFTIKLFVCVFFPTSLSCWQIYKAHWKNDNNNSNVRRHATTVSLIILRFFFFFFLLLQLKLCFYALCAFLHYDGDKQHMKRKNKTPKERCGIRRLIHFSMFLENMWIGQIKWRRRRTGILSPSNEERRIYIYTYIFHDDCRLPNGYGIRRNALVGSHGCDAPYIPIYLSGWSTPNNISSNKTKSNQHGPAWMEHRESHSKVFRFFAKRKIK